MKLIKCISASMLHNGRIVPSRNHFIAEHSLVALYCDEKNNWIVEYQGHEGKDGHMICLEKPMIVDMAYVLDEEAFYETQTQHDTVATEHTPPLWNIVIPSMTESLTQAQLKMIAEIIREHRRYHIATPLIVMTQTRAIPQEYVIAVSWYGNSRWELLRTEDAQHADQFKHYLEGVFYGAMEIND